ncbi:hypothetical protein CIB48_g8665 [Xylaria polymorpha]|nr:hypothetical protein CIB48_g8665 [Xylaria polymorpha]
MSDYLPDPATDTLHNYHSLPYYKHRFRPQLSHGKTERQRQRLPKGRVEKAELTHRHDESAEALMLGVQLILDYLLRTDIQTCHLVHGYNTLSSNMDCEVALSLEYSASCVEILGILNIVLGEEVNA